MDNVYVMPNVPRYISLHRTWSVDYKYIVVDPLPAEWDDYSMADKERWLRTQGSLTDHKFQEHVSVDDGSWDLDPKMIEESLS